MTAVGWVRRHQRAVMRLGGALLVAVGVLLVTGAWDLLIAELKTWIGGYETVV